MTRFLWTGESEFCICGHYLTDYETLQSFIAIATQEAPTVTCRGCNRSRSHIRNCNCDQFGPYRIATEEDKEVIESKFGK